MENFKLKRKLSEATSKQKTDDLEVDLLTPTNFSLDSLEEDDLDNPQETPRSDLEELEESCDESTVDSLKRKSESNNSLTIDNSSASPAPQEPSSSEKIQIPKSKQKIIEKVESGPKNDAIFVSKCLDAFFDRETLLRSTVSGLPCRNKKFVRKGYEQLDPQRLSIIKSMFHKFEESLVDFYKIFLVELFRDRIKRERVDEDTLESRLKKFNAHINVKIQNCRKYYYKRRQGDSKDDWWTKYEFS